MQNFKTLGQPLLGEKIVVVGGGGWVCKPILVFSLSFDLAEQLFHSISPHPCKFVYYCLVGRNVLS